MSTLPAFEVTPEALEVVAHLLQQHPEMQAGLILVPNFEVFDEQGKLEARFERESFWMAYDAPDKFLEWPRVELCGQSVPAGRDASEKLRGKTLTVEASDALLEGCKLLVAANNSAQATPPCACGDLFDQVPSPPDRAFMC